MYIGFYDVDPDFRRAIGDGARTGDNSLDKAFRERVVALRDRLPPTLKLLGSYGTQATAHPNVFICETDNQADLAFISNYYTGYLVFDWVPANAIGTTTSAARETMDAGAANR